MKHIRLESHALTCGVLLLACIVHTAYGQSTPAARVNGTLTEIDGIPVLRVWGTPYERGYAQGFYFAEKIVSVADMLIGTEKFGGGIDGYTQRILPRLRQMEIETPYQDELRGLVAGVEARFGGPVVIPRLQRHLQYTELVALNCLADVQAVGCSSFAAWGRLTADGDTIAGRNLDVPTVVGLSKVNVVIVNTPSDNGKALGWVSVNWPGLTGCFTGMSAEGVTVNLNDAKGHATTVDSGFTPRLFILREAIESARPETAFEDVGRVLRKHKCTVGSNVMVARPYDKMGSAAQVFEYDGDLATSQGVTARPPVNGANFIICTSHYRARSKPEQCDRYDRYRDVLDRIEGSSGRHRVTCERGWKMLRSAIMPSRTTYQSVVFEPNKRLMHVAFSADGQHAPQRRSVTLDVAKLLAGEGQ
ncbi:MAG: hypothetical protein JSU63_13210 [Phycisphaerales bacterium]|nr:MAG: hypothetical protein JSU63_13210 [Phycisphaerales bacterium]